MNAPRRLLWGLLVLWVVAGGLLALRLGQSAGGGAPLMPLDDVYIHFQYARQMALGQPYVYNPGDPATSGGTSFLYPVLLAVGYALGFREMWLGGWALLVGWGALGGTALGAWHLLGVWGVSWRGRALGAALVVSGVFAWHFNSGMETGLVLLATVWTLWSFTVRRWRWFALWGSVLAMLRPEASAMAGLASVLALAAYGRRMTPRERLLVCLPVAAAALQPLVNLLITGSAVATGNQSKSVLSMLPADSGVMLRRVLENWLRIWVEAVSGAGSFLYLALLGLVGIGLVARRQWAVGLLVLGWLMGVSLAVSTLDNAFWHFKRYQMLILLLLVLGGAVLVDRLPRAARLPLMVVLLLTQGAATVVFAGHQARNLAYVVDQPLAMALWLRDNTPADARIAVHDVGLMRYVGERATHDMVGLTTAGAASYWRNGVGSTAELLLRVQPDFLATYGHGHGFGLGRLEETLLLDAPLARFVAMPEPASNVALAAPVQLISQPDYTLSPVRLRSGSAVWGLPRANDAPLAWLNVADLASEQAFGYRWERAVPEGFLTDILQLPLLGDTTVVLDGVRRLHGSETFTLRHLPLDEPLLLVTRAHAAGRGRLEVRVNNELVAQRVLVYAPGHWQEFASALPPLADAAAVITLTPVLEAGEYAPASHFVYAMEARRAPAAEEPVARFHEDGFALISAAFDPGEGALALTWHIDEAALRDARMFVHVYRDLSEPPVTQWDGYALGGQPTGNWLPGLRADTIRLETASLPAGEYTLALGFYDAISGERLAVTAGQQRVDDRRLILTKWTVVDG